MADQHPTERAEERLEELLDLGMNAVDADCYVARDNGHGTVERFDLRETLADMLAPILVALDATPSPSPYEPGEPEPVGDDCPMCSKPWRPSSGEPLTAPVDVHVVCHGQDQLAVIRKRIADIVDPVDVVVVLTPASTYGPVLARVRAALAEPSSGEGDDGRFSVARFVAQEEGREEMRGYYRPKLRDALERLAAVEEVARSGGRLLPFTIAGSLDQAADVLETLADEQDNGITHERVLGLRNGFRSLAEEVRATAAPASPSGEGHDGKRAGARCARCGSGLYRHPYARFADDRPVLVCPRCGDRDSLSTIFEPAPASPGGEGRDAGARTVALGSRWRHHTEPGVFVVVGIDRSRIGSDRLTLLEPDEATRPVWSDYLLENFTPAAGEGRTPREVTLVRDARGWREADEVLVSFAVERGHEVRRFRELLPSGDGRALTDGYRDGWAACVRFACHTLGTLRKEGLIGVTESVRVDELLKTAEPFPPAAPDETGDGATVWMVCPLNGEGPSAWATRAEAEREAGRWLAVRRPSVIEVAVGEPSAGPDPSDAEPAPAETREGERDA